MTLEATFVAGSRWYGIRATHDPESLRSELTISLDGRFEWTFGVASWRPINLGVAAEDAYLWSARELILLPSADSDEPLEIKVDEDLLFAFRVEDGWALVCETSVRRLVGQEETARWELPDVVLHASWRDGVLLVRDDAGAETRLKLSGPGLTAAPGGSWGCPPG